MCALFGWLDYKGIVPCKTLKKLTQALANAAEERGTDASGIAYINDDRVTIFKRPKPAHRVHFNAPDGTRAIMGHTRMTTQGNEKHNFNNHPFPGHADRDFAFDSLKYMAESVSGNFTFTVLDEYNSLFIIKGNNPMCLLHFADLGIYIYGNITRSQFEVKDNLILFAV